METAYKKLAESLGCQTDCVLITDEAQISRLPQADCLAAVPMSGAVQRCILAAAHRYKGIVLYGAYIFGNADREICETLLRCNAAPTLMDTWAVLHRSESSRALLALNPAQLASKLRILDSYCFVSNSVLLQIGNTEPWVISNASDSDTYRQRFQLNILPVQQEEMAALYRAASRQQAKDFYDWFRENNIGCTEPTDDDVWNASRMAWALLQILERYHAQGAAIACFNLLAENTNSCLGVSYVNGRTSMVASCEGDMDSAITMLMMKRLASSKLWMANPDLQPDNTVNFSHCTAPIFCTGSRLPCTLRSHHESGIGVSLQVEMPAGAVVTACRVSNEASQVTIHRGTVIEGAREPVCRTQMRVLFDDPAHYLNTVLGCHQVFAFEDITEEMRALSELFRLEIL